MVGTKPYLRQVGNDPRQATAALELVEYLGATFGASGAVDALYYYERLGWVGAEARRQLTSYLRGLSVEELHHKKYDDPVTLEGPLEPLCSTPFAVHAKSLRFIARIAGDDLEEQLALVRVAESRTPTESDAGTASSH